MNEVDLNTARAVPVAARRRPGQHAREVQRRQARRALALAAVALGVLVAAILLIGFGWVTVAVEAAVSAVLGATDRYLYPVVARWSQGAAGEEKVGAILTGLTEAGWHALHDVDLGRGNIDHVVLGPAGIFTIETKSHRGRIDATKLDRRWLAQAYAEAKTLERITGLEVESLLVFSHAYLTPAVSQQRGVTVLPARMLAGHLERRAARKPGGRIPAARITEVYGRLADALSA